MGDLKILGVRLHLHVEPSIPACQACKTCQEMAETRIRRNIIPTVPCGDALVFEPLIIASCTVGLMAPRPWPTQDVGFIGRG